MKKLSIICMISCMALISCAQGVNLMATKLSVAPGAMFYVGTDQLLKPLYAPTGTGTYLLSITNGQYSFMSLANAATSAGVKGDKGDKGDTGATGPQGLTGAIGPQGGQGLPGGKGDVGLQGPPGVPGVNGTPGAIGPAGPKGDPGSAVNIPAGKAGQVLGYIGDNQLAAIDATFSLDAPSFTAVSTPITLTQVTAAKGGQYSIGGYVYIRSTDGSGSITLKYSFTDNNGNAQTGLFTPVSATAVNVFPLVIINCKAGTPIKLETVFSTPAQQVVYDTGANIHEK